MRQKAVCYLGLGSNVGERLVYLRMACLLLESTGRVKIEKRSCIYETAPVGYRRQAKFYNCVIRASTDFLPEELLNASKSIEKFLGRKTAGRRWGPRVIDIDILQYDKTVLNTKKLVIPHRELYKRFFWLAPLAEIEKTATDFFTGKKWSELKNNCGGGLKKVFPAGMLVPNNG